MNSIQADARSAGRRATHSPAFEVLARARIRRPRRHLRHDRAPRHPGRDPLGERDDQSARRHADDRAAAVRPLAADRGCGRPRRLRAVAVRAGVLRARARGRRRQLDDGPGHRGRRSGCRLRRRCACSRWRSCSARRASSSEQPAHVRPPACSAGRAASGSSARPARSSSRVALYQGYKGLTPKFLEEDKTEQMGAGDPKRWITVIGVVGHLARMVAFGLIGIFLVRAAHRLCAVEGRRPGRRARQARPPDATGRLLLGWSRRRADRVRAVLDRRRPLPADLRARRGRTAATLMRIDCAVGNRIAAGVRRHHSRRLGRLGSNALDPPAGRLGRRQRRGAAAGRHPARRCWSTASAALRAMVEEVRSAVSHVHLTAWFLSPSFVMAEDGEPAGGASATCWPRPPAGRTCGVLLWAGAPVPVFRPSRRGGAGSA